MRTYRPSRSHLAEVGPGTHQVPRSDFLLTVRALTAPSESFIMQHATEACAYIQGIDGRFSWSQLRDAIAQYARQVPGTPNRAHAIRAEATVSVLGDGYGPNEFRLYIILVFPDRRSRDACFESMTVAAVLQA